MFKSSLLLVCCFLLSGCVSSQITFSDLPEMSLKVISIRIAPEEGVSKSSRIIAELEYEVQESDIIDITDLVIMAQVATTRPGLTFDGSFPISKYPKIQGSKGRVIYEFPLSHVWSSELYNLKRPVEIHYHINYRVSATKSIGKAATETYYF